jgi:hypothetical protein
VTTTTAHQHRPFARSPAERQARLFIATSNKNANSEQKTNAKCQTATALASLLWGEPAHYKWAQPTLMAATV